VVTVGHKERGHGGGRGSHGGSTRWQCGVELGRSRRKVMTGGAHLSAGHGEGHRRHEVRRFPVREATIGQGATDARSARPRGRAGPAERPRPSGERESGQLGNEKGSGPWLGRKLELGPIQVIKHF
jgi:hypothetical protein